MLRLLLNKTSTARSGLAKTLTLRRVHCLGRSPDAAFPPAESARERPNGLVAIGGDLHPDRLERAYRQGIFPWYQPGERLQWWSPNPRSITIPGQLRLTKNLRRLVRQSTFQITFDQAFRKVVMACAAPRASSTGTWISGELVEAYCLLHARGKAHSVEVWQAGQLVGGQFGISIGAAFFGESMFSRASNASKISYVHFAQQLHRWNYQLIDGQFPNDHMTSLGAITISRHEYLQRLQAAIAQPGRTAPWRFDDDFNPLEAPPQASGAS